MILLDTNVVSAAMRPDSHATVLEWLSAREASGFFVSAITIAEIYYGLCCLPEGKKRRNLEGSFRRFIDQGFYSRILDFDLEAGRAYGELMSHRKMIGRPMSIADGQIAAIASIHRLTLATRNTKDFRECGLQLVDPFEES